MRAGEETTHTLSLLPCPFCGGRAWPGTVRYAESQVREEGWGQDTFHFIRCERCGADTKGAIGQGTLASAAAKWNRRYLAEPELVEACREALRIIGRLMPLGCDGMEPAAIRAIEELGNDADRVSDQIRAAIALATGEGERELSPLHLMIGVLIFDHPSTAIAMGSEFARVADGPSASPSERRVYSHLATVLLPYDTEAP